MREFFEQSQMKRVDVNLEIVQEGKSVLLLGLYLLEEQDQHLLLEYAYSLPKGDFLVFCPHVEKTLQALSALEEGKVLKVDVPILPLYAKKEGSKFVFEVAYTEQNKKVVEDEDPKRGLLCAVTEEVND